MPLNDYQIEERCLNPVRPMVKPFVAQNVSEVDGKLGESIGVISYGLSSFGLDIRVGSTFKLFSPSHGAVEVDPKNFDDRALVERTVDKYVLIPPHSYALAESVEEFDIPRDIITLCVGKSTYARCGIIVNVTPFEPDWKGTATLEIANTNPLPARVYAGEGLAQVIFFHGDPCRRSYADKGGKYQDQKGVVPPKMLK